MQSMIPETLNILRTCKILPAGNVTGGNLQTNQLFIPFSNQKRPVHRHTANHASLREAEITLAPIKIPQISVSKQITRPHDQSELSKLSTDGTVPQI